MFNLLFLIHLHTIIYLILSQGHINFFGPFSTSLFRHTFYRTTYSWHTALFFSLSLGYYFASITTMITSLFFANSHVYQYDFKFSLQFSLYYETHVLICYNKTIQYPFHWQHLICLLNQFLMIQPRLHTQLLTTNNSILLKLTITQQIARQ